MILIIILSIFCMFSQQKGDVPSATSPQKFTYFIIRYILRNTGNPVADCLQGILQDFVVDLPVIGNHCASVGKLYLGADSVNLI